ncbi:reverse transcriptase [Gossypium australe]|uniref:Reverse transcriptase n=1 Tax=Gossypium australe TaxID=47621 RepID=A0A5B6WMV3_9ROSI|nr:reverse transcriptase [Gossypium australe]
MKATEFHRVQTRCRMQNGLVVNVEGRSGGLALMWTDEMDVTIQNYSKHHIDSIIMLDGSSNIRVTGYYGHANPNERNISWNMLRRVGAEVREKWVVGGDFNAMLNEAKKEGGRRIGQTLMNDFRDVVDDLALVDIKPDRGWFTWVNNKEGHSLIKEKLDGFLTSVSMVEKFPFVAFSIIRQSQSDYDAILFDLYGRKPKDYPCDNRLRFHYEDCWESEKDVKRIINRGWIQGEGNYENKLDNIQWCLGSWQKQNFWRIKRDIKWLEDNINKIIDSTSREDSVRLLREYRSRLNFIYAREQMYWEQRSRVQWLKQGDRNTKFFHAKATGRLKKNRIEKIKDENGTWVTDSKDICMAARNYFWNLFRSNGNNISQVDLSFMDKCITKENNDWLIREYNEAEVKNAIRNMDPRKALSIDGLSGNFFKQHWNIVEDETIRFCLDILNGQGNITSLNETVIILIPKIRDPCDFTNFRPISLCRYIYKIIAKVLANRLKVILSNCISYNQIVFVPGRMIHDNILIAHELLHYHQNTRYNSNKGCVIKLDMSKAYDRVEWNFIEEVMRRMWFAHQWIDKIMGCVCSVKYLIKCNNMLSETIYPERGLRQGDPLSPGIRASVHGPRINHLFFADDALLFVRNKNSELECFMHILKNFFYMSGQEINFKKSMILFSPNTPNDMKCICNNILNMRIVEKLDKYLGLPLPIGKRRREAFTDIINRLSCRINSWTKRLLSYGGKEIMIKAVLQSIPTYAMSIFLAPRGVLKEIQKKISRSWWSGKDRGKFWSVLSWKTLCHPKGMGGIGLRNMILFNIALIGRQVWRLINNKKSLCFKVLSSKYFPDGNIFNSKKVNRASFTWSSIATAVDFLKNGFSWQVGKGEIINIKKDNWGMEDLNGSTMIPNMLSSNDINVKDLWMENARCWNVDKVQRLYGKD